MHQEMRRADRQISGQAAEEILRSGAVCHLAMVAQGEPYLVTLNFGFRAGTLYFHCADVGRKLEILDICGRVCFTVVPRHELVAAETACSYSMRYESVVGYGTARFIEGREAKGAALGIIMAQYADGAFEFSDLSLSRTRVFAVDIDRMTAKSTY